MVARHVHVFLRQSSYPVFWKNCVNQKNPSHSTIFSIFANTGIKTITQWTPTGDAFIIGSDLNRLESETLPQYFRHNRFQSLVRQLNFYSFRKINRERNVWIYKHHLFHRDRPESLHLVRRRTCPGLDGRKQRFSRFSARKLRQNESGKRSDTDDESSIDGSTSGDEASCDGVEAPAKKRDAAVVEADNNNKVSKRRAGRIWNIESAPVSSPVVDTSMLMSPKKSTENVVQRESDEDEEVSLGAKRNERLEMIEQSMIVSDVAMKLEEYARKAMRGRGGGRTRRGGAGVVTPPFGSSQQFTHSATGLLTYDDEYDSEELQARDLFGISSATPAVVTDGDDSLSTDVSSASSLPKELLKPPVCDQKKAKAIVGRILANRKWGPALVSGATVAGFCMTTAPHGDRGICSKIMKLISSCDKLAAEFHLYRAALEPLAFIGEQHPFLISTGNHQRNRVLATPMQIWEREVGRREAIRDFKIFSVNVIHKILGKGNEKNVLASPLTVEDRAILEYTAETWRKSVGAPA